MLPGKGGGNEHGYQEELRLCRAQKSAPGGQRPQKAEGADLTPCTPTPRHPPTGLWGSPSPLGVLLERSRGAQGHFSSPVPGIGPGAAFGNVPGERGAGARSAL